MSLFTYNSRSVWACPWNNTKISLHIFHKSLNFGFLFIKIPRIWSSQEILTSNFKNRYCFKRQSDFIFRLTLGKNYHAKIMYSILNATSYIFKINTSLMLREPKWVWMSLLNPFNDSKALCLKNRYLTRQHWTLQFILPRQVIFYDEQWNKFFHIPSWSQISFLSYTTEQV